MDEEQINKEEYSNKIVNTYSVIMDKFMKENELNPYHLDALYHTFKAVQCWNSGFEYQKQEKKFKEAVKKSKDTKGDTDGK